AHYGSGQLLVSLAAAGHCLPFGKQIGLQGQSHGSGWRSRQLFSSMNFATRVELVRSWAIRRPR
ncbi:MAG: hypothetical protein ACPHYE_02335, partial [Henriciella sp.]